MLKWTVIVHLVFLFYLIGILMHTYGIDMFNIFVIIFDLLKALVKALWKGLILATLWIWEIFTRRKWHWFGLLFLKRTIGKVIISILIFALPFLIPSLRRWLIDKKHGLRRKIRILIVRWKKTPPSLKWAMVIAFLFSGIGAGMLLLVFPFPKFPKPPKWLMRMLGIEGKVIGIGGETILGKGLKKHRKLVRTLSGPIRWGKYQVVKYERWQSKRLKKGRTVQEP